MGRLLEDMTRLVGEIQALRGRRRAFRKELEMDVFEMCADFAATQVHMAERSREVRLAFVDNLKQNVAELRRQIRADLDNLKQTVAELKQAIRADLAGARRAWAGRSA
jgi:hypothetical protein